MVFSLCYCSYMVAQVNELENDLKNINKKYLTAASYDFAVSYKLANQFTHSTVEQYSGYVRKRPNYIYNRLGNSESVQEKEYIIKIDKDDKEVYLGFDTEPNSNKTELEHLQPLKGISNLVDSLKVSSANTIKTYTLYTSSSQYNKVILSFDTKSYFLKEIILYSQAAKYYESNSQASNYYVKINYRLLDSGEGEKKVCPTVSSIITKVKNTYQLTSAYSEFELSVFENKPLK